MAKDNHYLNMAYKKLKEQILLSDSYQEFIFKITATDLECAKKFTEAFTFDNGFDADLVSDVMQNIDGMNYVFNDIGEEKIFNKAILDAVKDKDPTTDVINTHLIETKYGNVFKEDLTYNDAMFSILESFYGLDTIIMSVSNKEALKNKFFSVMNTNNIEDYNAFNDIINDLYNDVKDIEDYETVKEKIREYKEYLSPYILEGLGKQINQISNSNDGNFASYDVMYKQVSELLGYGKSM